MGIVIKESAKSTLISFVGTAIGAVSTLFVYTLDLDAYGFSQVLIAVALLLAPIASWGWTGVITRFFPQFQEGGPQARAAFLTMSLVAGLVGFTLFALVSFLYLLPWLERAQSDSNQLTVYLTYRWHIGVLVFTQMLAGMLDVYIQNFRKITVQTFIDSILRKLLLAAIIFLSYLNDWTPATLADCLVIMQAVILGSLFVYLVSIGEWRLSFAWRPYLNRKLVKEVASYAGYMFLGVIGSKIALQIDTVSLGAYVSTKEVGVYRIVAFAAALIAFPLVAVSRISAPIVADAFRRNDHVQVEKMYRDASRSLTLTAVVLFLLLYVSLDDVFRLTGRAEAFSSAGAVFLLIGGANVYHQLHSINNLVVSYSMLYRYNLIFILLLSVLNIALNWLFIARMSMGSEGAALATFVALTAYNSLMSLLVYSKLGLHPFSRSMVFTLLTGAIVLLGLQPLTLPFPPLINIGVRSLLIGAIFTAYVLFTAQQPEAKRLLLMGWKRCLHWYTSRTQR